MGIDITTLTTNTDKLGECTDKNEKREQDRKDEQLHGAIERKVKKEEHKRKKPRVRDGIIKKCTRLFKEGASPEVLTTLEESLRKQEKYYRYYVQCFLPILNRKIPKELDPIKKEGIGQVISEITYNSKYYFNSITHNQNGHRNSEDNGIGSDSNHKRQTNDKEPKNREKILNIFTDENINDRLLETAKRDNKKKIKKLVQKGADISTKDGDDNNTLHYVVALQQGKQRVACLNLILGLVKKEKISQDKLSKTINLKEGQTPLQKLSSKKITKGEHSSERVLGKIGKFLKKPFTQYDDHTIESAISLFKLGANVNNLQLSKEELQNLDKKYRKYHFKLLEKLAESVGRSTLEQRINIENKIEDITARIINTPDANGNHLLHSIIDNYDKNFLKKLLRKGADISLKDANVNNILHLAALLKKKQKRRSLNALIEAISKKYLAQLVDSENQDERTPLQVAFIDKITKGKYGPHTIQDNDNTLKFFVTLLEHEVKPDQLELSQEVLQNLNEKQKVYYLNFLEKLAESVKKPELELEIKTKIKEIIARIINTPDGNDNYLLHSAIKNKDEKLFKELLQKGADISIKGASNNNALHLIVIESKKEQKLEFLNIVLNISEEKGKEQLKAQFKKAVDTENTAKQTPLHQVLQHIQEKSKKSSLGNKIQNVVKKEFNATNRYQTLALFLQNGADISKRDGEGNNALHYIVSFKGKQKVVCLKLISDKDGFSNAVNTPNKEGRTPLHQLLQYIEKKSESQSLTDKKFEKTNRYKILELFLQNGADITIQDKEGNNALHYIMSSKGKQKVTCLDLISGKSELSEAETDTDDKGTLIQEALKGRAMKEKFEHLSQHKKIVSGKSGGGNTTKFCAILLKEGANPHSLWLEDEKFHTKKYYLVLRNAKNDKTIPQKARDKAKELKEKLEAKYGVCTISKWFNSQSRATADRLKTTMKKIGHTSKAVWKCVDSGRRASILLAITVVTTIIIMVTLSCFQGQIVIGAALPIIAITGMVCLIFTLGFNGIKKSTKEFTTDKQGVLKSKDDHLSAEQGKALKSTVQQNVENKHKNSEKEEIQESSDQSKDTESLPSSKIYGVSIFQVIKRLLGFNEQINKPSSLAR
ncbi:ankyrin repeat domain-containing protein [Wolbachia endosymbiont of Brugia pahangi]|uniref:ankyrin repeat domain-containing protein n=1 Tax=Wolbachia endosymbiont of Brugia pahangi TaxID=96495 RepID=UPI00143582C4|nr:ankyrin repeat domain-containing protein [Wolbachia endosymbiont of Brugia pahangi]QIT36386.1 ankyrin repeats family protein [Wolbachia endosymbiont of Brugia pahangi]